MIELNNVRFSYGGHSVLQGIDFFLCQGDRVGLTGAIGSGKTTLLHLMVGLLKPTAGKLRAFGKERRKEQDFAEVRRRVGLVFQDADDQLFCPTVLEDLAFGPLNLGKSHHEAREQARRALISVGLEGFEDRITYKLSGGEKRLAALATVLAMEPEVLLLDEPTTSLDAESMSGLIETLKALPQSMLIVSHSEEFLAATTSRRLVMEEGRIRGVPPLAGS